MEGRHHTGVSKVGYQTDAVLSRTEHSVTIKIIDNTLDASR